MQRGHPAPGRQISAQALLHLSKESVPLLSKDSYDAMASPALAVAVASAESRRGLENGLWASAFDRVRHGRFGGSEVVELAVDVLTDSAPGVGAQRRVVPAERLGPEGTSSG